MPFCPPGLYAPRISPSSFMSQKSPIASAMEGVKSSEMAARKFERNPVANITTSAGRFVSSEKAIPSDV